MEAKERVWFRERRSMYYYYYLLLFVGVPPFRRTFDGARRFPKRLE